MKWIQLVAALGLFAATSAATAAPAPVADQVRAEIMPDFEAMEAAANVHDADAHLAYFANDPSTVFLAGDHRIVGWQAILDQQRKWWPGGRIKAGSETPYTLTAAPDFIVLDPKAALLSFILDAPKTNPDEKRIERTIGVTQLWRKRPEGWRVVYAHESVTVKSPPQ
jgi:ketosteroid isomerase-like protein